MIFQKPSSKIAMEANEQVYNYAPPTAPASDDVETIVGPSVNVEGDFSSQGNIVVKGSVAGNVHTSKHLSVEPGAKITANVRAGSARIAGEVKGNMKIKETLEITSTAKILGDIDVKTLTVEPGALLCGKITMPGVDTGEAKVTRNKSVIRKVDETAGIAS